MIPELPTARVLDSFGLSGPAVLLQGGQGETFRAGNAVLKQAGDPEVATWIADLFSKLKIEGARIARPIRSRSGGWLVDGYGAQRLLAGNHEWNRWNDVLATSAKFHKALETVSRPSWMDRYDDVYRRADKFAWGEGDIEVVDNKAVPLLNALLENRSQVALKSQLVHADIGGNVLFDGDSEPAVIDFRPYWRPVDYVNAIVVVDAISWHDGSTDLIDAMLARKEGAQLLVRAALFRVAVDAQQQDVRSAVFDGHRKLVETLVQLLEC